MANFELTVLCLLIPILYAVVYMAGRADVIGEFIRIVNCSKKDKNDDIYERVNRVIEQLSEARACAFQRKHPESLIRAKVLDCVIDILREELLMEDLQNEVDE